MSFFVVSFCQGFNISSPEGALVRVLITTLPKNLRDADPTKHGECSSCQFKPCQHARLQELLSIMKITNLVSTFNLVLCQSWSCKLNITDSIYSLGKPTLRYATFSHSLLQNSIMIEPFSSKKTLFFLHCTYIYVHVVCGCDFSIVFQS